MVIVEAHDPAVDAVGAVVGSRGSRIKPLVAELDNEKVDVVRWSDSLDQLIGNLIAPNRILEIRYDEATRQARITLQPDSAGAFAARPDPAGAGIGVGGMETDRRVNQRGAVSDCRSGLLP